MSQMRVKDPKALMKILALKKKVGKPTQEINPGANTDSSRELLETSASLIVFVNFQTGDDGTGDGTSGNPFKTYAKGVAEVGATSKTHVEWQTDDTISEIISVPTQASVGVIGDYNFDTVGDIWVAATTPSFGTDVVQGVTTDSVGNWVAVGGAGKIAFSTDKGDTWTQATTPSFASTDVFDVATDSLGNWVAVGLSGKIAFSTDNGDTWTQATTPSFGTDGVLGVATDSGGNWVAVGAAGKIALSSDNGDTWVQATTPSFGADRVNDVATDSLGNWVAVGEQGKVALSSDNGDTWVQATTPSFLDKPVQGVITDSIGFWIAGASEGRINFSTDNGDTWTEATTTTFSPQSITSIATDSLGDWVAVGGGGKIALTGSVANIDASFCGFSSSEEFTILIADLRILQCSVEIVGRTLISTVNIEVQKCNLVSTSENAVEITGSIVEVSNSIVRSDATDKIPLTITGFAAGLKNIFIEFCTIKAFSNATDIAVKMDNTGGTGLEQMHNNIIEGGITATELTTPMTVTSGSVRGAIIGALNTSKLVSTDPLFLSSTDLRIQRESGYSDTDPKDFDSPLVRAARSDDNASVFIFTVTSTQVRDFGAFSFDDSNVSEDFTFAKDIPKPEIIQIVPISHSAIHEGVSGEYDEYNDIDRRGERLVMKYRKSTLMEVVGVFEMIEKLSRDAKVFIAIDLADRNQLPDIIADGAHTAGQVVLNIDAANIWNNAYIQISGIEYAIVYALNAANEIAVKDVTQIVLQKPLETSVADDQVLTMDQPFGLGDFVYDVGKNPGFTRVDSTSEENLTGFGMTFVRKKL